MLNKLQEKDAESKRRNPGGLERLQPMRPTDGRNAVRGLQGAALSNFLLLTTEQRSVDLEAAEGTTAELGRRHRPDQHDEVLPTERPSNFKTQTFQDSDERPRTSGRKCNSTIFQDRRRRFGPEQELRGGSPLHSRH